MPPLGANKIHSLTSLRFFAAFYVVLLHTLPLSISNDLPVFVNQFVSLGYISVSFFFFLSGYILALVYFAANRRIGMRNFFVARFARIYPIFVVCLLLDSPRMIAIRAARVGMEMAVVKTAFTFLGHIFMLQAWTKSLMYSLDPPAWSLSVEALFYLLFPFIGGKLWSMRESALPWFAASLYLFGQIAILLAAPHMSFQVLCFCPLFHVSTFLLGVIFCRWHLSRPVLPGRSANLILIFAMAAFLGVVAALPYLPRYEYNLRDGVLAPLFAMVILALAGPETLLSKLLSNRTLVLLGEASFSLYLLHLLVDNLCKSRFPVPTVTGYLAFLVICVLLSVLSFVLIETPARSRITRLFKTRPRESMELATDASA